MYHPRGGGEPGPLLVLAHGAGAGQRSSFMVATAEALASRGVEVATFNFPYTEQRRRVPDRRPVLEACYGSVVERMRQAAGRPVVIGGKSMGGRIATHVAAETPCPVAGVVLLGYPLHPPRRSQELRDGHFPAILCPMLFVQGSRDTFGTPEELAPSLARLAGRYELHVVDGGDHSFKIARAAPAVQRTALEAVYERIAEWIRRLNG